ncbi:MAG: hypothetical protein AB1724_05405 [Thermodesulfobacteriota bacterium]
MKNTHKTLTAAAVCLMMLALAAGCAALSQMSAKHQPLEERVKGYMQAQIEGRWEDAYGYLDAATRGNTSRDSYIHKTRKANYTGYEIAEVNILPSGDQAKVKVKLDISFMGYDMKGAPLMQNWVKEKGAWYVVPQPKEGAFAPGEKEK